MGCVSYCEGLGRVSLVGCGGADFRVVWVVLLCGFVCCFFAWSLSAFGFGGVFCTSRF